MPKTINRVPFAPKLEQKKRVAAYARVSTGKDAMLHSLSSQVGYYSEVIQKRSDWEYAGVYADEYTSYGQNPKRPWIPTISVFTGVFIIQSLLTLPT